MQTTCIVGLFFSLHARIIKRYMNWFIGCLFGCSIGAIKWHTISSEWGDISVTPKQKKYATWALIATFVLPLIISFIGALADIVIPF